MKIAATLLMLLVLFLPHTPAQDVTHLNLPEGAVARLGKGRFPEIQYSPDGTRLAVASTIGIWLYDTTTYREVALITGPADDVDNVAFSPDGKTLAGGSGDGIVQLWDAMTGELKRVVNGADSGVDNVAFSPDGGDARQWRVGQSRALVGHRDGGT